MHFRGFVLVLIKRKKPQAIIEKFGFLSRSFIYRQSRQILFSGLTHSWMEKGHLFPKPDQGRILCSLR